MSDWGTPTPDDVWTWALELAEMAYGNPGGYSSEAVDDHSVTFNKARRAEILETARRKYSTGLTPVYSFPAADWHWTSVTPTSALTD